jgi:hypothetical protein
MASSSKYSSSSATATYLPWWALPVRLRRTAGGLRLEVQWARLAGLLAALALAGWLGLACAGYLWVRYKRDFDEVRFVDILLPHRWKDYRLARGNYFVAQAKRDLEQNRYREAFHHLRVGIATAPGNLEGRQLLAQFFAVWGRPDLAQKTLVDGLPYAGEQIQYLRSLLGFLLQNQEDEEVIRIAHELLPTQPIINERNQLIALAAATSRLYRGDFDAAEDYLNSYNLLTTKDGRLLQARLEWDRGYRNLALIRLQSYINEFPNDDEFFVQLSNYHRELGNYAEVERYAVLRQLINPANPAARIDLIYAYHRQGATDRAAREIDIVFRDFADNPTAMLALADLAANTGNPTLARRVYDHTLFRNLGSEGPALMWVEANIVAGRYQAALDLIGQFSQTNPEWARKFASVSNGLQAIASYGLGRPDDGERYLTTFLSQASVRADNLVAVSNRLLALGAQAPARRVLVQATAADPKNQAALTKLIELEIATGQTDDLAVHLRRLLTMRRPSLSVLESAYLQLSSDRHLFATGRAELLGELRSAIESAPRPQARRT